MDLFVDLKVPAVDGSQWTAAERQREEKSLCGNDLQTLLDFCGSPQNDAVERVMGIEPTSKAWEAFVLPLNYTRGDLGFYGISPAARQVRPGVRVAARRDGSARARDLRPSRQCRSRL